MKQTNQSANGTSFHGTTIRFNTNELKSVLGEPVTGGVEDKITREWEGETDAGDVFTVYDWKEYREFGNDETVSWHIGGHSRMATEQAKEEIESALKNQ